MKLIIVRHGQTEENVVDIIQGQSIGGTLTELGKEQARKTALRLKDEKIDIAYVSDLTRAVDTAKEILKFHPDIDVVYSKELRERSEGVFEGSQISKFYEAREKSELPFHKFKVGGGESTLEAQQRIKQFYNGLFTKHEHETVLVVSHGAVIAALLLYLLNKPLELDEYIKNNPENTAVTTLEIDDSKKIKVITLNSTEHL